MTKGADVFDPNIFGKGVYGATEALELINFRRDRAANFRPVSRQTVGRRVRGYTFDVSGERRHIAPLWSPDYGSIGDDPSFELSFRDLIELRFVKIFRDLGLGLQTIRECFHRAVEETKDTRPFSSQKFKTDGRTIFLHATDELNGRGELVDLRTRQSVFKSIVEPSLKDLDFDAGLVTRWFPLGRTRSSVVLDPNMMFGRPILGEFGVSTQVIASAIAVEGGVDAVARLYELPKAAVRQAQIFEETLAA